jgi:hypothetical protein
LIWWLPRERGPALPQNVWPGLVYE